MRAVACADAKLSVVDLPDPAPAKGQLVLGVLRCGICGSDLHAREHCDDLAEVMDELDYDEFMRTIVGHGAGPRVRRRGGRARPRRAPGVPRGRPRRVLPAGPARRATCTRSGSRRSAPGGYAEQVLVEQSMSFVVPNGLAPDVAVLTEPMAVALHAVNVASRPSATSRSCWAAARSGSR